MAMNETTQKEFIAEMLCLADTDWVLGHWYIKVMLNGRSLTDCTAFAGMAQDTLGHTRAIFKYLEEEFDLPEHQLEFGRDRNQVHDMEMLSAPPENWGDFLVSAFLAEGAVWSMFSTFQNSNSASVAGMVRHFGKELYFHRLGIEGWLKSAAEEERSDMREALSGRLPGVIAWFDDAERSAADPLVADGIRSSSLAEARANFVETTVTKLAGILGIEVDENLLEAASHNWDSVRRRERDSELPATLWEFMIPTDKDTVALRRPLAVSIDDNLDLFDRPEYSQDD